MTETAPRTADNLYRHYKGGLYRLLHEATNSETLEPVMVYRSEDDGRVWVCPIHVWRERVYVETPDVGATRVRRFEKVEP